MMPKIFSRKPPKLIPETLEVFERTSASQISAMKGWSGIIIEARAEQQALFLHLNQAHADLRLHL